MRDKILGPLYVVPHYYFFLSGVFVSLASELLINLLSNGTCLWSGGPGLAWPLFMLAGFEFVRAAARIEAVRLGASSKQPPDRTSLTNAIVVQGRISTGARSGLWHIASAIAATVLGFLALLG